MLTVKVLLVNTELIARVHIQELYGFRRITNLTVSARV